jgi:transcriptional antiterminator NusG
VAKEHEDIQPEIAETDTDALVEASSAAVDETEDGSVETRSDDAEQSQPGTSQEPDFKDSVSEDEIADETAILVEVQSPAPEEQVDEGLNESEEEDNYDEPAGGGESFAEAEPEAGELATIQEDEQLAEDEEVVEPVIATPKVDIKDADEVEEELVNEPEDDRHWYVVHCYSGYENKVRHNLEQRIETMGMKNKIFDVVVPTEEEIEVKDGKRRTVERRVFPGYILVQMLMDEDSWYVVRNTPGVTGFVGMGNDPTPLRQEEVAQIVKRMEADAPRIKVTYKTGQKVRIVDGPFNDFIGTVADINMERAKVRVMVSFFGRETPVELDFLQVEKA